MIVNTLGDALSEHLPLAEEVWIASALVTLQGFNFANELLRNNSNRTILIGIDLSTPVEVLKTIQTYIQPGRFSAKIGMSSNGIFHPKFFLIRKKDGYIAFIGSANLTMKALYNNTELTIAINDQEQCLKLKTWFEQQYTKGYSLTQENIKIYESYRLNQPAEEPLSSVALNLKMSDESLLGDMNFEDRYFSRDHHLAFRKELWQNRSESANKERFSAQEQFLGLHENIYLHFEKYGLTDLHPNKSNHIVSMYYHHDTSQKSIDAMWLSYGKSQDEIKEYHKLFTKNRYHDHENDLQSFINHARLQIRIELTSIGIWILFGKNNGGGIFDRDDFLKQMQHRDYRSEFFRLIKSLPDQYWIRVNKVVKQITTFLTADDLHIFCKTDNRQEYFIIGRDYQIYDHEMSSEIYL